MSGFGLDEYGLGPYGGAGVPSLYEVAYDLSVLDVLGGDVITVIGNNFAAPMTAEVLSGVWPEYVVEGECYMFDARYDLSRSKAFYGTPALAEGTYHLRVTNPDGSALLLDALVYGPKAYQLKVERVRAAYAPVWRGGPRIISGNGGI